LKHALWLTYVSIFLGASGAAAGEGFGLKPGLWEVTQVRQVSDGRDITEQMAAANKQLMQQAMANMSPEQRQQMEAMMGRQGAMLQRVCVSPAMAARDKPFVDPQGHCEPSKFERSGNRTTFQFDCRNNGIGAAGKGESIASGDTILTRVDSTITTPSGSHTMQGETKMRFVGRDCQGIKPLDELSKDFNGRPGTK
jgi:hypothetical protein